MRVFGGPGQNRGLVESEKWVFVCVVDVNGLTFVVGSNGGLEAIPTHSLARVRTPQTAAAIDGSRPVHGGATKTGLRVLVPVGILKLLCISYRLP